MCRLQKTLAGGLHSRNGFVRKGAALMLQAPRRIARARADAEAYLHSPPILANSFPKSGTHLLDQIAAGFPDRVNYGAFLSSLTSSFQLRPRSPEATLRFIRSITPGELVRAHLFFDSRYADALHELNVVHYFIYRDPRDVIVSSCHYLREMNRWHRLHKYFKRCRTMDEAILLSIRGLPADEAQRVPMPDVAGRFAAYRGWLDRSDVLPLRFEDLRGAGLDEQLARMVDFYAGRSTHTIDRSATVAHMRASISPEKSHTFRKGGGGGWREEFTPACKDEFKRIAGDLLIQLGYERDNAW